MDETDRELLSLLQNQPLTELAEAVLLTATPVLEAHPGATQ